MNPETDVSNIGRTLKKIMLEKDMSNKGLESITGIPKSMISQWRNGVKISPSNFRKILTGLEMNRKEFFAHDREES